MPPLRAVASLSRFALTACAVAATLAAAGCSSSSGDEATVSPERSSELQQLIDEWSQDHDPVGVAAAVMFGDGELWVGAAGLAHREDGVAVEPSDRFEVASITKTFMSALTLRLAEEGLIELDAPIAEHLPSFPAADQITIRQLLGHRAGIHDPTSELVSDRDGPPDPEKVFSPDELLGATAAGTPTYPPGSTHEYSNASYWVLAAVLEAATERDAGALLAEFVFEPLGLDDTVLFDASLPEVEVVNAYTDLDLDGAPDSMGTRPLPGFVTPAWTAGGVVSTVTDLVTFLDGLFAGDLLIDASLDAMLDTSSGGSGYALGIYSAGAGWGHDGGIPGYLSAAFHDPGSGVTVAVATNRFGPDAPQADALAPQLASLAIAQG